MNEFQERLDLAKRHIQQMIDQYWQEANRVNQSCGWSQNSGNAHAKAGFITEQLYEILKSLNTCQNENGVWATLLTGCQDFLDAACYKPEGGINWSQASLKATPHFDYSTSRDMDRDSPIFIGQTPTCQGWKIVYGYFWQ